MDAHFCIGEGLEPTWSSGSEPGLTIDAWEYPEYSSAGECTTVIPFAIHDGNTMIAAGQFRGSAPVVFDRLRIEAGNAAESSAVWKLINRLIAHRFKGEPIMLRPCPLEYASHPLDSETFERRRAALTRLYAVRLGAVPFDDEWLGINVAT
jgi:hypothetical protein